MGLFGIIMFELTSMQKTQMDLQPQNLVTLKEASLWAENILGREVAESNISYLVQYGKVEKHTNGKSTLVDLDELSDYYASLRANRQATWKQRLGQDLNWRLSFEDLLEKDTTKHVHRLHPYKGKFIPQLVEYFLDDHTDEFKTQTYFSVGDIVLDPFVGSGTTLVQANELGMHALGVDVSEFNCTISEVKLLDYDLNSLSVDINRILAKLRSFEVDTKIQLFEVELTEKLADFNGKYFPSVKYKVQVEKGSIDETSFASQKEREFLPTYLQLVDKYKIELNNMSPKSFLDKWYMKNVRKEVDFIAKQLAEVKDAKNKKLLSVVLSRTVRSCRATTHSDLATLVKPQVTTYYCWKHKKICKPLFSVKGWFSRYALDTLQRLNDFKKLRSDAYHAVISADSRLVGIQSEVDKVNPDFGKLLKKKKIAGIFTSPPYVGQIDYHEQHAYAYDLFAFTRRDESEIGPLFKGQGMEAKKSYVDGISQVLLNCKRFLTDDYNVFLVANDKYNLYPTIAERSGMQIVNQYKRPVLNRTEKDKSPYSEIIFHLKREG